MLNLEKEWAEIILLLKLIPLQQYRIKQEAQEGKKYLILIIMISIMRKWITFVAH